MDIQKRELVPDDALVVIYVWYEPLGDPSKGRSAILIMVMGG